MEPLDLNAEATVDLVWEKARPVYGYDPDFVRKDPCGAWISRTYYGCRDSLLGWEIDHIYPRALGGTDVEVNLRPMHWRNNISKGDDYPHYKSAIRAEGDRNIERRVNCTVGAKLRGKLAGVYNLPEDLS